MTNTPQTPLTVGIIGGGVAGMSCALWLKHLGYFPCIIERNGYLGGQLSHLNRINHWVLGFPQHSSAELAMIYAAHIRDETIALQFHSQVVAIAPMSWGYELQLQNPAHSIMSLSVRALVLATGVRVAGRGIFGDSPVVAALCEQKRMSFTPLDHLDALPQLNNRVVAIIGGGDNAHYTAKDVAATAAHTHLIVRSTPKAQLPIRHDIERLIEQGALTEHQHCQATAFEQRTDGNIRIQLSDSSSIDVDRIFVRVGFVPNSDFLNQFACLQPLAKDPHGYLLTDAAKRTNLPCVYAIGDVANSTYQSIVMALADGAIAARDISLSNSC